MVMPTYYVKTIMMIYIGSEIESFTIFVTDISL